MPDDLPVGIVREGTKPTQETLVGTLGTIVGDVARTKFAAPAIVVIGNVVRERDTIRWFDTHPLFGKRVLVTRARGAADEFAEKLWEIGAEPVLVPAIAIGPPDDPAPARAALDTLDARAWIVFTSANGVDAAFDGLSAAGHDARRFGRALVAAIGPKTAERLMSRGIRADYVPSEYVAEAVAAGLLERTKAGDTVLSFGAQEMRDVLADTLRAAGRTVDVVAAYKTTHVRDEALARAAEATDVWTFTSASTVASFVENVPQASALQGARLVAALGPVTAKAARDAGLRVDCIATSFTIEGLVEALAEPVAG